MGPPIPDRLIPQLCRNLEWPLSIADRNGVLYPITIVRKSGVRGCLADDSDVMVGTGFVEACGQKAIVFQIANGVEQSSGYVPIRISKYRFVNLNLIRTRDAAVVRLVLAGIGIVVVAGNRSI